MFTRLSGPVHARGRHQRLRQQLAVRFQLRQTVQMRPDELLQEKLGGFDV